jgi:hypothetical protein
MSRKIILSSGIVYYFLLDHMTKEEHLLFSGALGTNIKDLDWPTGMDWKRKPIYSYMTPFSFLFQ